jgi:hypothetical protein
MDAKKEVEKGPGEAHRIRVTLNSQNTENIEKGESLSPPSLPHILAPSCLPLCACVEVRLAPRVRARVMKWGEANHFLTIQSFLWTVVALCRGQMHSVGATTQDDLLSPDRPTASALHPPLCCALYRV